MAAALSVRGAVRGVGATDRRRGARRTGLALPHVAVYQSRSGRPEDPWLGPDICDFLRQQKQDGRLEAAVIVPAGFICDHIEVLYDLDTEAAAVCARDRPADGAGRAVNDHPLFLDMMADVVQERCGVCRHATAAAGDFTS